MSTGYTMEIEKKERIKTILNLILKNEIQTINFSGTGVNYYTLGEILEEMKYEKTDFDTNGWQMDVTATYEKENYESLIIHGTAITFEIHLSTAKYYYEGE